VPIESIRRMSPSAFRHDRMRPKGSEDGAIAIMTPFVLIVMLGMFIYLAGETWLIDW